jgi:MFS family permease
LLFPLLLSNLALFTVYLGVGNIFLPTQVSAIDPDPVRKALNLSLVAGGAAVMSLVAQPLLGVLSDRSRRRTPWILGGGILAGLLLQMVPHVGSIVVLLIVWCVIAVFMNGYQAAVTAVVPDRVPRSQRGVASAFVGIATPAAAILGVGSASALVGHLTTGYAAFGAFVLVSAVIFVVTNPEHGPADVEQVSLGRQMKTLLSALAHRDFLFAFLARASVMMAYLIVFAYLLYTIQGRIDLPPGMADTVAITVFTVIAATCMVIGTLIGGMMADRLRRYRVFVVIGALLMACAAVPPLVSTSFVALIVYGAFMGLGFGAFLSVDTAIVTLVLPHAESNARDLGILNIANTAPQTLAAVLAGLVVASLGGGPNAYGALFAVSMGFAVVGAFLIWRVRGVR